MATVYSPILSVVCDDIPQGMNNLILGVVNPTNISISWPALTDPQLNGGDLPIFYSIEFKSSIDDSWSILNPGGAVTLNYLHDPGYIFDESLLYYYRVRAQNGVGMANAYSAVLTVTPDHRPQGMNPLILVTTSTGGSYIRWNELTDATLNGGDIPNFYSIEYSPDNSNWYQLNAGGLWVLNFTHNPGAIMASDAYYRVRA
jgi:hypothetical protein